MQLNDAQQADVRTVVNAITAMFPGAKSVAIHVDEFQRDSNFPPEVYDAEERLIAAYQEAGKKQQACRTCEPGHDLRCITIFLRDAERGLWMSQPAYHGVGPCGISTVKL